MKDRIRRVSNKASYQGVVIIYKVGTRREAPYIWMDVDVVLGEGIGRQEMLQKVGTFNQQFLVSVIGKITRVDVRMVKGIS